MTILVGKESISFQFRVYSYSPYFDCVLFDYFQDLDQSVNDSFSPEELEGFSTPQVMAPCREYFYVYH